MNVEALENMLINRILQELKECKVKSNSVETDSFVIRIVKDEVEITRYGLFTSRTVLLRNNNLKYEISRLLSNKSNDKKRCEILKKMIGE